MKISEYKELAARALIDEPEREDGYKAPRAIFLQMAEPEISWADERLSVHDVEYIRTDVAMEREEYYRGVILQAISILERDEL